MMRASRQDALDAIAVGDIIFAATPAGKPKIMLVYERTKSAIRARHITSQTRVEFGRDGQSRHIPSGGSCGIVSTARLSPTDDATARGLDRKMRQAKELTDLKLSTDEIALLSEARNYFEARPLPE